VRVEEVVNWKSSNDFVGNRTRDLLFCNIMPRPTMIPRDLHVVLTTKMYSANNYLVKQLLDRLCGLVASVPGYRSRGPGSIPGSTRFSEK
jgi:hypothetical protein